MTKYTNHLTPQDAYFVKVYKNNKSLFHTIGIALIMGIIAHLYMLTNKFPNADDVSVLNRYINLPKSGRWILWLPTRLSGTASAPWSTGFIALVYLAISVGFTAACLKIRSMTHRILLAMTMTTFPVICSTFFYMAYSDAYFFALMMTAIAAYIADKYKFGYIIAIPLIILSLGIYQAYFCAAAALMCGVLLTDALKTQLPIRKILIKSARFVFSLGVAMAIYIFISKNIGQELAGYMGIDKMGILPLSRLPLAIGETFANLYKFYFANAFGFHTFYTTTAFVLITIGATICVVSASLRRPHKRTLLTILLITAFLAASNLTEIMVTHTSSHLVMLYALVFPLALVASICDIPNRNKSVRLIATATSILLFLTSFHYFILGNQAYLKMQLLERQAYAFSIRLIDRIEDTPNYDTDKTIILIGRTQINMNTGEPFENLYGVTGISRNLTIMHSYKDYLASYVGLHNEVIMREPDVNALLDTGYAPFVDQMPYYPTDGSIAIMNNYIFVKFGEPREWE